MSFRNRIRLPLYISKPQFPTERNIFRKADGSTKTQSVIVRKTFAGVTEYLPEELHQKLIIALSHDDVHLEDTRYLTDISLDGDYQIEWQDFKDYPVAQAKFTIQVTPFNNTNSNCQTCDEATQLSLVDDYFPDPMDENTVHVYDDVTSNDSICCYPFTIQVVWYNPTYLASADFITNTYDLQIHINDDVASGTDIKLATYRVTCPDGSYDEADVYGDIVGSGSGCNPPSALVFSAITDTTATVSWTAASPVPANGYVWALLDGSNPAVQIQNGLTSATTLNLVGLVPNFNYIFWIQSDCDGEFSASIEDEFTTTGEENNNCGQFMFVSFDLPIVAQVSYMGCNGEIVNVGVTQGTEYIFCALIESGATVPYFFSTDAYSSALNYLSLC